MRAYRAELEACSAAPLSDDGARLNSRARGLPCGFRSFLPAVPQMTFKGTTFYLRHGLPLLTRRSCNCVLEINIVCSMGISFGGYNA